MTAIFAFSIGESFNPEVGCVKVIAAHTDSPAIKLSPIAKMKKSGYLQPSVQLYGGGMWHTWFDRDLTLAGKVIIKNPNTKALEYRLFHHKDPLLRIPNLAIHFTHSYNKLEFNPEKHLRPFFGTEHTDKLISTELPDCEILDKQFPALVDLVGKELNVNPKDIIDIDFNLVDTQPASLMGIHKEFISSGRLDNQISCYCGLESFKELHNSSMFLNNKDINILALFDHEEIGSMSMQIGRASCRERVSSPV